MNSRPYFVDWALEHGIALHCIVLYCIVLNIFISPEAAQRKRILTLKILTKILIIWSIAIAI